MTLKTKNFLTLLPFITVLFFFSNCSKYEDGPNLSLLSKTSRLTGEWEIAKVNGETATDYDYYDEYILEFEKDGDFHVKTSYTDDNTTYSYDISGEWEWDDEKESVTITLDGDETTLEILRLTNKELWFAVDDEEWELEKI